MPVEIVPNFLHAIFFPNFSFVVRVQYFPTDDMRNTGCVVYVRIYTK